MWRQISVKPHAVDDDARLIAKTTEQTRPELSPVSDVLGGENSLREQLRRNNSHVLGIGTYRNWKDAVPSARAITDAGLTDALRATIGAPKGMYGRRRDDGAPDAARTIMSPRAPVSRPADE